MFNVALCACPKSMEVAQARIKSYLGPRSEELRIYTFDSLDDMYASETKFELCLVNKSVSGSVEAVVRHVAGAIASGEGSQKLKTKADNRMFSFIIFVSDPLEDENWESVIECVERFLGYDSMYIGVTFLTDKGLKNIALSKILYFELYDRKIRIKTQGDEFVTNDTLQHIMTLVGGHGFYRPHKSFIVNLKHIATVKNYIITMNDESQIPLSQKKSSMFRKTYKAFLTQQGCNLRDFKS